MLAILKTAWEVLVALPGILKLVKEILTLIKSASGNDLKGFVVKSNEAVTDLKKAETDEEKVEALKKIQSLISGL